MESTNKIVTFRVVRNKPEMIVPAKPTPHEFQPLSDIDDQVGLRFQIPIIQFYEKNSMQNKDPVDVIRKAIAKALVFYYPFAGRLREYAGGKLVVECTGEGILFIEADADVALEQLGALHPPFSYLDSLLYDVPVSNGVINCPLLLIQVTRLKCGGFVFAIRFNHTMSDGAGIVQFMSAVGELACGAEAPTVEPVWQRHLLSARMPPHVTRTHFEYDIDSQQQMLNPPQNFVDRAFFFSASDISALRSTLPPHLRRCTRFELVVACVWWCRTVAFSSDPNQEIRISCMVNCRKRFNPPLPEGYYGNAIVYPATNTTAKKLSKNSLPYALELVRSSKSQATGEYVKSVADLMVTKNRPLFRVEGTYLVSDVTRLGFREVDFGWGKAAFGGPAKVGVDVGGAAGVVSFVSAYKDGIMVPLSLPENAMDTFINQLHATMTAARKALLIQASEV